MSTTYHSPSFGASTPAVPADRTAQADRPAQADHPAPKTALWRRAADQLPNVLVFSLLAGVMVVGHQTGWALPKSSALFGQAPVAADDWCEEHLVPESTCVECRPDLLPKPKPFGFCREHGVAECVVHHPELAQVLDAPRLPKYDTVAAVSVMARPVNNSQNMLHRARVQFASAESVEKAGVDVDVVHERRMLDQVSAPGELSFAPNRVAHLSTRAAGSVARVLATVGDTVERGQVLALVDAAQVGQAKTQLLNAVVQLQFRRATVERLTSAGVSGALAGKSMIEAESALREGEIAYLSALQNLSNLGFQPPENLDRQDPKQTAAELRFLGIPADLYAAEADGSQTANLIPIRAPFPGVVTDSEVVAGEAADPAKPLFTVADPSRLWLILNIRQSDVPYIAVGQTVHFQSDGGQPADGVVSWLSPSVDPRTRTLQVRVEVDNPEGRLRDKTYGAAQIVLRDEPHAVVVPREAVQSTADAQFVFVRDKNYFTPGAPKIFHVRQVRTGARDDQFVELLSGALPGEVVAVDGASMLLAQLLRGNLGAGCGCHEN